MEYAYRNQIPVKQLQSDGADLELLRHLLLEKIEECNSFLENNPHLMPHSFFSARLLREKANLIDILVPINSYLEHDYAVDSTIWVGRLRTFLLSLKRECIARAGRLLFGSLEITDANVELETIGALNIALKSLYAYIARFDGASVRDATIVLRD